LSRGTNNIRCYVIKQLSKKIPIKIRDMENIISSVIPLTKEIKEYIREIRCNISKDIDETKTYFNYIRFKQHKEFAKKILTGAIK